MEVGGADHVHEGGINWNTVLWVTGLASSQLLREGRGREGEMEDGSEDESVER